MHKLVLHSSALHSQAAKLSLTADAKLASKILNLSYHVSAATGAPKVVWPKAETPQSVLRAEQRRDELWKTTCLEAFLYFSDDTYIELNFSPVGYWNAYSLESYRKGLKPEDRISEARDFNLKVSRAGSSDTYELSVSVDLSQAVKSPQHFRLGLTSVIETSDGERSYWSLKHSGDKPDFHDSRGHILEMRI